MSQIPMAEDFLAQREAHPLDDAYWASKRPILEKIEVPALVCANWSDHGLHTRGSIEAFERISSAQKWLFTQGGRSGRPSTGRKPCRGRSDFWTISCDTPPFDIPISSTAAGTRSSRVDRTTRA
jgi:hypothetical protein